ncbi:hypothetical protein AMS68_002887 [Peltaster fructicola]|uniref:Protein kinase domain-containing protein n=1 Tax=Peltaster fructicola TaxID=286661 RepID=A0A6H0XSC5_9PEZI|nr:hypothetical protein AMS68_002887 [Peltaster fructicola]
MDFFKSAVASISKGPAFPYNFGDKVELDQSIWTLHNGTKREDGSKCSILSFDVSANRNRLTIAKNALRKYRTLRHPGIVKVLDTVETDQWIYIAIEKVVPLSWMTKRKAYSEETLKWGLYNVAKTIKFINDEAASVHGAVRTSSIFCSASDEWKVGGLEICSTLKESDAVIFSQASLMPDMGRYTPPEAMKSGWDTIRSSPAHAVDSYGYGILVAEVFAGNLVGSDAISNSKGIPSKMQTSYKRLVHAVPKMRLSVGHFLEQGARPGAYFDSPLINLTDGIENLGLKSDNERDEFLSELEAVVATADLPEHYMHERILPELLKAVEFSSPGGTSSARSLSLAMQLAAKLDDETYTAQITPIIVRLFSSPDRALRVSLLDNLPHMIDHLQQKIVTDKIFPQLVTGFGDLAPVVREQTVKAVLVIVPKLADRVINGELLRHLAKTANDDQPGIRTNTTICLGKIARNLSASSRAKVLSAAFSRSLRDPFVHARNAGLLALAATADIFSEDDCASKMLPAICPSLVDREKMIRVQAERTMNIYLERVRKYSQTLPDNTSATQSEGSTRVSSPQPAAGVSGAAGAQLLGWAISSFTNKLSAASGEIQPNGTSGQPPLVRSSSTPGLNGASGRPTGAPHLPSAPVVPRAPSGLRVTSSAANSDVPEDEDFNDTWGDMNDEPSAEAVDAWESAANNTAHQSNTLSAQQKTGSTASTPYDDGGEPDFEGWLNAQSSAKTKSSKPLPKGLIKKAVPAARPTPIVRASSGPTSTRSNVPITKAKTTTTKEEPKAAQEDDDWGDAWN